MFTQISAIVSQLSAIVSTFCRLGLSIAILFGMVTPPATTSPIEFKDSENVKMSAVLFADSHIRDTGFSEYFFQNAFKDIENSEETFDAFVLAGDITEFGDAASYEITWNVIENYCPIETVLLATGNHDIRLAYEKQTSMIMNKQSEYFEAEIDKAYYSYDVNGYTFVVMGSDEWQLEKAIISDEQLSFLDSELSRATKNGKPAFVVCHQPLANTHGLPEVWKNGDIGEQSDEIFEILTKYKNVFYINGHLHDGVYEKSLEVLSEENGVYSINLPAYGKVNDYGIYLQSGLGTYMEVYDDEVVFTARDFKQGEALDGYTRSFTLVK